MPNQDMLSGGKNTFAIDVDTFYRYWMPSQKDTVYAIPVASYKEKILSGAEISAPLLQSIQFDDKGERWIRTLDGRHRIAAAKAAGIKTIHVRMSDELIEEIEHFFSGVILESNIQKRNDFTEETDDDSYEEDLKFFQQFLEKQKKMQLEPPAGQMNFSALNRHFLFSSAAPMNTAERASGEIIRDYMNTVVSNN